MTESKVRLDKYLWAIRIFKTRSAASKAISLGKVKLNGDVVKAAKTVNIGEEYHIKTEARKWVIQVSGIIESRVQYADAVKNYEDKTPAELLIKQPTVFAFNTGKRQSKIGRPTKKQRRNLEDLEQQISD